MLFALMWMGRPDSTDNSYASIDLSASAITANEYSFDFGEVSMAKGDVEHTFLIKNDSDEEVELGRLFTSCMCTTAELELNGEVFGPYGMPGHGPLPKLKRVMKPGEEARLRVIYDPAAHGPAGLGRAERAVYLENGRGALEVRIYATVIP